MMTEPMNCPICLEPVEEGAITWPGETANDICQCCWERECSQSWWRMVNAINESVHYNPIKASRDLNTHPRNRPPNRRRG